MQRAKIIIVIIVALLALIVMLQNTEAVETKLLFITVTMPRVLLLIITLLIGFILGIVSLSHLTGRSGKQDEDSAGQ